MDREAKTWKFARLLIAKHGKAAFELARSRAQDRLDKGHYRASSGWARMADILRRMTITGAQRRPANEVREPSLDEVLAGQTTQAVMNADKVDRRELDKVLSDAKKKQGGP